MSANRLGFCPDTAAIRVRISTSLQIESSLKLCVRSSAGRARHFKIKSAPGETLDVKPP